MSPAEDLPRVPARQVFLAFLRLGLTSFGGPVADRGGLRGPGGALPVPAGPRVEPGGDGVGLSRAGLPGAPAAWIGFTAPSAAAMILAGDGRLFVKVPAGPEAGGLLCLCAIFLPSFLLVPGVLPFWGRLRALPTARSALAGANAAVVGLLLAAFYDPVWSAGIRSPGDAILGLLAFGLLALWKVPPWAVVLVTAAGGWAASTL